MNVLIATVLAVLIALPATAKELPWPKSEWKQPTQAKKRAVHRRKPSRIKRKPQVDRREPQVRGATFIKIDGFICAQEFKVFGQVKSNEARARRSAWTAFHRAVKFELGERFADGRFAKNVKFRCPESSSETLTNKAIEAIGGEVKRVSCTLRALACQPPETD